MNVSTMKELFTMQQELDGYIETEHPREVDRNRLGEKVLALQIEIAECGNEWRGFKYWSNDQKPRTNVMVYERHGEGPVYRNYLLEEFVDCLHFTLSIGIELNMLDVPKWWVSNNVNVFKLPSVLEQFSRLIVNAGDLLNWGLYRYDSFVYLLLGLGEMLGFTEAEIVGAYKTKHAENIRRQENGY